MGQRSESCSETIGRPAVRLRTYHTAQSRVVQNCPICASAVTNVRLRHTFLEAFERETVRQF